MNFTGVGTALVTPFTRSGDVDERALRCEYPDGARPYVVHHWPGKPWQLT